MYELLLLLFFLLLLMAYVRVPRQQGDVKSCDVSEPMLVKRPVPHKSSEHSKLRLFGHSRSLLRAQQVAVELRAPEC